MIYWNPQLETLLIKDSDKSGGGTVHGPLFLHLLKLLARIRKARKAMTLLSKQDIFSVDDVKIVDLEVPEWGGTVRLRSLSAQERDDFESSTVKMRRDGTREEHMENFRARLVSKCLIDEDGKLMFTKASEITMLGSKSAAALQRIFNECQKLNGLSDEDVEDLTQDFEGTPEEDSTSD